MRFEEALKNYLKTSEWKYQKAIDEGFDKLKNPVQAHEVFDQLSGIGTGNLGLAGILRSKPDPKQIVRAYKLFRVEEDRPGELLPLFVKMLAEAKTPTRRLDPARHGASIPIGSWQDAEIGASAGVSKTGKPRVASKLGPLAFRPGFHAGDYPIALHIGGGKAPRFDIESGEIKWMPTYRRPNEVWAEVDMSADVPWQDIANSRATLYMKSNPLTGAVKGMINPSTAAITDQIPEDGFYRYKTNPNMLGNWLIGGAMKINRLLPDEEVASINEQLGIQDLPRIVPFDWKKYGF